MDDEKIGTLIELIYTSSFEQDGWNRLLQTLLTEFQSAVVTSVAWSKLSAIPVFTTTTATDRSVMGKYESYYHTIDPGFGPCLDKVDAIEQIKIFSRYELFPISDFIKTEFYNDFAKHIDSGQSLMATIGNNASEFANIHFHRPFKNCEFSGEEYNLLAALTPHLNRGLRIHREIEGLRAKAGLFADALDTHGAATFMLDATGKLLFLNQVSEQILKAGSLTQRGGRLMARHPQDDAALQAALRPPQPGIAPGEIILRESDRSPALRLAITPVNGGNIPLFLDVAHTSRVAFMVTAAPLAPNAENLRAAYGLTPAEAEITLLLLQGARAAQIAAARDTSPGTVNTQLKNIYAKMGVAGHVELLVKLTRR